MRVIFLTAVLIVPLSVYGQGDGAADNPFGAPNNAAEDGSPQGAVTFALDGGTLLCEFGRREGEKGAAAMIVHPATVKRLIASNRLPSALASQGAAVLIVQPDAERVPLRTDDVHGWAKSRIREIGSRESSVEEHAFVAVVVHALTTGERVQRWGSAGVAALEAGKWGVLFIKPAVQEAADSDADPFGGADPFE